jgi:hypothetical protein
MQLKLRFILCFGLIVFSLITNAQQNKLAILQSSKWKSEFVHTDSNLIERKEIRLLKLYTIEDTLRKNPTWTFERDSINFRYFFPEMRRNKIAVEEKGPFFGNVRHSYKYDAVRNELVVDVPAGKRKTKPIVFDVQVGTEEKFLLLKVIDKRR